jgi:GNAT superfamily N-acetyltransferase
MPIRRWTKDDLVSINGLLRNLAQTIDYTYHDDLTLLEKQFELIARYPDLYTSLVYTVDGETIGFISVVYYPSILHHKGTALINELVVGSEYQRKGIGKELVSFVIDETRQRGFDEVEVGLEKQNTKAADFYKMCGMEKEYLLLGMEFV